MTHKRKTSRPYRKITLETVALHKAAQILHGNGSRAVRETNPEYLHEGDRAYRIQKKADNMPSSEYLETSLQQIAHTAVRELGELVSHPDPNVRTRNVHYALDQVRGKAVQKTESKNVNINIESVLS